MMPLLGEAFLTSAISPGLPTLSCALRSAPMKSLEGCAPFVCSARRASGRRSFILAISTAFHLNSPACLGHCNSKTSL